MADGSNHPCYRAIQQNMESITQTVDYNKIIDKVLAKELITVEDFEEHCKLPNTEAVRKLTIKVMSSTTSCEEFLGILHEMQQPEYTHLAQLITDRWEHNKKETNQHAMVSLQEILDQAFRQMIPQNKIDEILKTGEALIDHLLKQEAKMMSIVEQMQLKRSAGKGFTEFLMYIIKLLQKAITNKTISLKKSVKESTESELNSNLQILMLVHKVFCSNENETKFLNDSIALVVTCAIKVKNVIKVLQKSYWLKLSRSAKNISALVPIFEKINQVMEGIQYIECRGYSELIGDVADLKASLEEIHERVLILETVGLSANALLGIGGVACLIIGTILFFNPMAPLSVPFFIGGGVALGVSLLGGGGTELCNFLTIKYLDHAEKEGTRKGNQLVKDSK